MKPKKTPRGPALAIMIATPKPGADDGSTSSADNDCEFCVPADAFKIAGTAPEEGDEVTFTGKGKVTSVDGDQICVSPTEINGKPVTAAPDDDGDDDDDDDSEMSGIMDAAQKADSEQSGDMS